MLYLTELPKITREMGTVKGVEGQQVAIECKASGKPAPQYEFFRVSEHACIFHESMFVPLVSDEILYLIVSFNYFHLCVLWTLRLL